MNLLFRLFAQLGKVATAGGGICMQTSVFAGGLSGLLITLLQWQNPGVTGISTGKIVLIAAIIYLISMLFIFFIFGGMMRWSLFPILVPLLLTCLIIVAINFLVFTQINIPYGGMTLLGLLIGFLVGKIFCKNC